MRKRYLGALIAAPALLFGSVPASGPAAVPRTPPTAQDEVIPNYIIPDIGQPDSEWRNVCSTASTSGRSSTIVANVDSGPGTAKESTWARAIRYCANQGLNVVGYVDTDYTQLPLAAAERNIARWVSYYRSNIHGIFLDDVGSITNGVPSDLYTGAAYSYYDHLYKYVNDKIFDALVVLNPGATPPTAWLLSVGDIINVFEGTVQSFESYTPAAWMSREGLPSDYSALVYGATDAADVRKVCTDVVNDGIGNDVAWGSPQWTSNPEPYWSDLRADGC